VVLMSDVCDQPIEDYIIGFATDAPTFMGGDCNKAVYRPTDEGPAGEDVWPGAPAGPYGGGGLHHFGGEYPNGQWRLYVYDDETGETGDIEGGWFLRIDTEDPAVYTPGTGTSGPADPFPYVQNVTGMDG